MHDILMFVGFVHLLKSNAYFQASTQKKKKYEICFLIVVVSWSKDQVLQRIITMAIIKQWKINFMLIKGYEISQEYPTPRCHWRRIHLFGVFNFVILKTIFILNPNALEYLPLEIEHIRRSSLNVGFEGQILRTLRVSYRDF